MDLEDLVGEMVLIFDLVPESEMICEYAVTYDG